MPMYAKVKIKNINRQILRNSFIKSISLLFIHSTIVRIIAIKIPSIMTIKPKSKCHINLVRAGMEKNNSKVVASAALLKAFDFLKSFLKTK